MDSQVLKNENRTDSTLFETLGAIKSCQITRSRTVETSSKPCYCILPCSRRTAEFVDCPESPRGTVCQGICRPVARPCPNSWLEEPGHSQERSSYF